METMSYLLLNSNTLKSVGKEITYESRNEFVRLEVHNNQKSFSIFSKTET